MDHSYNIRWLRFLAAGAMLVVVLSGMAGAQIFRGPNPGDVYREFSAAVPLGDEWIVTSAHAKQTWGSAAGPYPNRINYISISGGALSGAIRAEAVLTVWGGHVGTTNKQIRFNNNYYLNIPELQTTPSAGQCYIQQANFTIDVPTSHLQEGDNEFQAESGDQTCYTFNWGQWGLYGVLIRVYYNPGSITHPTGSVTSPSSGSTFGEYPTVSASVSGSADRVDFLAYYDGYDTDGDGVWAEYHEDYNMRKYDPMSILNHVGTVYGSPWSLSWDNIWVPDQSGMKMLARIRGTNGVWYVTDPTTNLTLSRGSNSVVMFKPYNVGEREWAHDGVDNGHGNGVQVENVYVPSTASAANAVALVRTWHGTSPEDGNRYVGFNNYNLGMFGDSYFAKLDLLSVPTSSIVNGENAFTFYSPVPLHHGIEILWPGPALLIRYGIPLPVQLSSFTAVALSASNVELKWTTLSETNNFGFWVEKAVNEPQNFLAVPNGFVAGHGTTLEVRHYSFTDSDPGTGEVFYRLKQVDLDGAIHYTDPVRVDLLTSVSDQNMPTSYQLGQNYPNPFNPSATIRYALPLAGFVQLRVINQLGQTVRMLEDGIKEAGYHEVIFDATGLSSGVYFYQMESGKFVDTKKMILVR